MNNINVYKFDKLIYIRSHSRINYFNVVYITEALSINNEFYFIHCDANLIKQFKLSTLTSRHYVSFTKSHILLDVDNIINIINLCIKYPSSFSNGLLNFNSLLSILNMAVYK